MSLTASAQRVTVSAKTGSASNNSRAIPGYWLPCPVNNHAVVGRLRVLATYDTGSQAVFGQLGQALARTLDRIHDQRGAMFEMRTARPSGEAYVGEVDIRVGVQPGLITLRQRHQCFR